MKEKVLINKYPASNWQSASPIGNGRLGALVMGSIYQERIIINHEALFNGAINKDIPDTSNALQEVRHLMDQKRYLQAEQYYTQELIKKGYHNVRKGEFFPAFDFRFIYPVDGAFTDYCRELDLSSGVSKITFKENGDLLTREMFASFKDNFLFLNIKKDKPFSISFSLDKRDILDSVTATGEYHNFIKKFDSEVIDNYIYSSVITEGGLEYSGVVKLLETDGSINKSPSNHHPAIDMQGVDTLSHSINVNNATYLTIIIDVQKGIIPFDDMKERIDSIHDSFDVLKNRHIKLFKELFNKTSIDFASNDNCSNEELLLNSYNGNVDLRLIEKAADYGRYLLL